MVIELTPFSELLPAKVSPLYRLSITSKKQCVTYFTEISKTLLDYFMNDLFGWLISRSCVSCRMSDQAWALIVVMYWMFVLTILIGLSCEVRNLMIVSSWWTILPTYSCELVTIRYWVGSFIGAIFSFCIENSFEIIRTILIFGSDRYHHQI